MVAPSRDPFVPVAFAPDSDTARRYADALDAAGIEAHVRIEDGAHLSPTGSAYGSLTSQPFVYPVLVSRVQRRAAQRVISPIVAAGAATTVSARTVLVAGAFLVGTVLLVALAALLRGDL